MQVTRFEFKHLMLASDLVAMKEERRMRARKFLPMIPQVAVRLKGELYYDDSIFNSCSARNNALNVLDAITAQVRSMAAN